MTMKLKRATQQPRKDGLIERLAGSIAFAINIATVDGHWIVCGRPHGEFRAKTLSAAIRKFVKSAKNK